MILDSLANADRYRALGKRIAMAFDFLARPETARLEPKQTGAQNSKMRPILGDEVFALIQRYKPKLKHEAFWEAHRNYIDIQCMFEGAETMGWGPLESMGVRKPYDPERDYIVLEPMRGGAVGAAAGNEDVAVEYFTLRPDHFAIFFPSDAHMPGLAPSDQAAEEVKKIVVKVRV